jgi:hypothetical protein
MACDLISALDELTPEARAAIALLLGSRDAR